MQQMQQMQKEDWEKKTQVWTSIIFNHEKSLLERFRVLRNMTSSLCSRFITFQMLNLPLLSLELLCVSFKDERRKICSLDKGEENTLDWYSTGIVNNLGILRKARDEAINLRSLSFDASACFKERADTLKRLSELCSSEEIFLPEVFLGEEEPVIKMTAVLGELREKLIAELRLVANSESGAKQKLPSLRWVESCLNQVEQTLNKLKGHKTSLPIMSLVDVMVIASRF